MDSKETIEERKARFSRIWSDSRAESGKTQDFIANSLGVSKKTVQNWENGITSPDLFTGSEWFRILGINPIPYYLSFLFPDLFNGIAHEDGDDIIEQALTELINNATATEKRELLYIMAGGHGSPWYSLLQMFTAHCHLSMKSRVNIARTIVDAYDMESKTGELVCTDNIGPDMELLRNAVEEGKKSVIKGSNGYTNVNNN